MAINWIKTRRVWKAECQPSRCLSTLLPSLLSVLSLHPSSIRCVALSLSLMARLSFRRSLARWLTVRKAWIMSASTWTDRPSCAVGLFISRNLFKHASLSSQRRTGMQWVCEREGGRQRRGERKEWESAAYVKKKEKKRKNLPGVMIWAGLKQLEVTSLQAKNRWRNSKKVKTIQQYWL